MLLRYETKIKADGMQHVLFETSSLKHNNQNGYSNGKPLTCARHITISVKSNYVIAEITVHDEMIFSSKLYQWTTKFKFGNFRGASMCTHGARTTPRTSQPSPWMPLNEI